MIIVEGKTKLSVPDVLTVTKKDEVFYNPKMEVNRDISVSVIQAFLKNYRREEFLICDPLGGSGARGLRYANELELKDGNVSTDVNPNGSAENIAGICNAGKNVYGMMPHPERAADITTGNTDGLQILESMIKSIEAQRK